MDKRFVEEDVFIGVNDYSLIERLFNQFAVKEFKSGQIIFDQGSPSKNIYIIKFGKLVVKKKIVQELEEMHQQLEKRKRVTKEVELSLMQRGELFGELEILLKNKPNPKREYKVTCLSPRAVLYHVPAKIFAQMLIYNPDTKRVFLEKARKRKNCYKRNLKEKNFLKEKEQKIEFVQNWDSYIIQRPFEISRASSAKISKITKLLTKWKKNNEFTEEMDRIRRISHPEEFKDLEEKGNILFASECYQDPNLSSKKQFSKKLRKIHKKKYKKFWKELAKKEIKSPVLRKKALEQLSDVQFGV